MAVSRSATADRASIVGAAWTVVLLTLLVAVAGRGCRTWLAVTFLPTGRAEWIWARGATEAGQPMAFYAVRDFDLPTLPAQAELRIAASEEYLAWLNGFPVGAGWGGAHPPLDRWDVRQLVRPGGNRLVVEARSSWGAGGLLASLQADGDQPVVATDDQWRVFRVHRLGIVRGWLPLDSGEAPQVWTLPPTARWRIPQPQPVRVVTALRPPTTRVLMPRRVSHRPAEPDGMPALVFDFGREVVGTLRFEVRGASQPARLWLDSAPLTLFEHAPTTSVITIPGRGFWQDSVPRRFRYVGIATHQQVASAQVLMRAEDRAVEPLPVIGLLGIRPTRPRGGWLAPSSRSPVEDEPGGGF